MTHTHHDYAVLGRNGEPVTTASHLDIADQYAARANGLTVVRRVVTVSYEPVERAARKVAA